MTNRTKQIATLATVTTLGLLYGRYRQEKKQALHTLRKNSQTIPVKDGVVDLATQGEGPAVLILHGGGGGYEQGAAIGQLLELNQHKVISVSRPGHRRTPLTVGTTLSQQAQLFCDVLDHYQIDKAYIIAMSAGGMSGLQFAIDHPTRCAGLILLSAQGPSLVQTRPAAYWLWLLNLVLSVGDFPFWLMSKIGLWHLLTTHMDNNKLHDGPTNGILQGIFPVTDWRDGTLNDLEQLLSLEHMSLESIQVPTLLAHGDADVIVSHHVAVATQQRIPHAQLQTIANGSHLMVNTHGREIGQIVTQFMTSAQTTTP